MTWNVPDSPPLTDRVALLRAQLGEAPPVDLTAARWYNEVVVQPLREPFHEVWLAQAAADPRVRLARALAAEMAAVRPVLTAGELIIGGDAHSPIVTGRAIPFGNHIRLDLERAAAVKAAYPDCAVEVDALVAYWQDWLAAHPEQHGLTCHASLAYERVLDLGLDGLREYVQEWQCRNVPDNPDCGPWYEALLIAVDGMSANIQGYARAARQFAAGAETPALRDEWTAIADRCAHVAHGRPRTFAEAVQLFYFVYLLAGHDSPGPLDRYLWPALEADLAAERTTWAEAQELVDSLWLKFAERNAYGTTLGGQDRDGQDATNPLSFLCLESIRRLRLLSPRTALRWHRGLDPKLLARACAVLAEGPSFPAFVNDEAIVPSAVARGQMLADAREYTFVGCGQVFPHGRGHGSYEDLVINTAKPLEFALHNGVDPTTGEQVGPRTGELRELATFDDLLAAWREQLRAMLEGQIVAHNARRAAARGHAWDFLRSLLTYSCVERGRDWHDGGPDYSEGMVDMVGLATTLDSLLALRVAVYEQGQVALPELVAALDTDWEGQEPLRQYCLRQLPKFGNDDPVADDFVASEAAWVNDLVRSYRTHDGGPWGMDIIGWSGAVIYGAHTGATPDGRRRGEAVADSGGPAQGRNVHGLTATLNSVLRLPHAQAMGPLTLNLRFPPSAVRGRAKAGKTLDGFEIVGPSFVVTGNDQHEMNTAADATRQQIAFYGSTPAYSGVLELHGWDDLHGQLNSLSKQGKWVEMGSLITDEILNTFAVVGPPNHVAGELHRRYGDVIQRISFYAPYASDPTTWSSVIDDIKSA